MANWVSRGSKLSESNDIENSNRLFDSAVMEAEGERLLREGTMPNKQQLEAALSRIREEYAAKILEARARDQQKNSSKRQ